MKAQRGNRGIALIFFNLIPRWAWVVNATPWPPYLRDRNQLRIVQKTVWAPGPVWTGAEKSRLYRDSIPGPSQPVASRYTDYIIPVQALYTITLFYLTTVASHVPSARLTYKNLYVQRQICLLA